MNTKFIHDLVNRVSVISGMTELLLMDDEITARQKKQLDTIMLNCMLIASMIKTYIVGSQENEKTDDDSNEGT